MQWWHWLIIIAAFVLLFGAKKLPDAARGVGRSLRILKAEVGEMQAEHRAESVTTTPSVVAAPQPVVAEHPARRIA